MDFGVSKLRHWKNNFFVLCVNRTLRERITYFSNAPTPVWSSNWWLPGVTVRACSQHPGKDALSLKTVLAKHCEQDLDCMEHLELTKCSDL
jgi:hypothetical protein